MSEFTQRMTLHINGGSDHSALHFDVLRNGLPTGIRRVTTTNGSPEYLKTSDRFISETAEFDILANKGQGMVSWLEAQTKE